LRGKGFTLLGRLGTQPSLAGRHHAERAGLDLHPGHADRRRDLGRRALIRQVLTTIWIEKAAVTAIQPAANFLLLIVGIVEGAYLQVFFYIHTRKLFYIAFDA
jgi:hypothetical protein